MPEPVIAAVGDDLTNLGLSRSAHEFLRRLKQDDAIGEMVDGYRLGVAVAVASKVVPDPLAERVNVFGVASIDPTGELRAVVESEYEAYGVTPYRMIERLADWGIKELERRFDGERFDLSGIFKGVD